MIGGFILTVVGPAFAGMAEDVRRALALAGVPLKAAAIDMDLDPKLLRRQLDGEGHLSLARLSRIVSPEFRQWFALLQAQRYGFPPEVQAAATLAPRMLRMNFAPRRQEAAS